MRLTSTLTAVLALTAACSKNPPAATAPAPAPVPAAAAPSAPVAATTQASAPVAASPAPMASAAGGTVDLSGTWTMALDVGGQSIPVDITLAKGASGYTGDASPQGMSPAPLTALTQTGDRVSMTFTAPDGEATFAGQLSSDRRVITGTLNYNGQAIPFTATKR